MTSIRKHSLIRRVQDITLGTTLTLALMGGAATLQSCGGRNDNDYDAGTAQEVVTFKKGVRSVITETAPGQFKITDEVEADPNQSGAIIHYKDGHIDTLGVEAARKLVQNDPSTREYFNNRDQYGQHHSSGLANVLLWGGLGYMIGRNRQPNYNEQRYSSGAYANTGLYNRAQGVGESVRSSRVVTSRPSGGRSGFFGRSRGGGGGRGFGG